MTNVLTDRTNRVFHFPDVPVNNDVGEQVGRAEVSLHLYAGPDDDMANLKAATGGKLLDTIEGCLARCAAGGERLEKVELEARVLEALIAAFGREVGSFAFQTVEVGVSMAELPPPNLLQPTKRKLLH